MSLWNQGKLYKLKPGTNQQELFDRFFAERLGEHADKARSICENFIGHEMFTDALMILEEAIKSNKIPQGLAILEKVWNEDVLEDSMPPRTQMSVVQEEAMAASFVIADLALKRA